MKYDFSVKVSEFINNAKLEKITIGCSNTEVFKVSKNSEIFYLKIGKLNSLKNEYKALKWTSGKLSVPEIIFYESNINDYLITKELKGEMLCSSTFENDCKLGINIIVEAFNNLRNVDISTCPFNKSIDNKLKIARYNIDNNICKYENVRNDIKEEFKSLEDIYNYLVENKYDEDLVFSHGDISLPNIFALDNKFSGFIDISDCGIADIWCDIAICERSIIRNYGKEYADLFYKLLNINKDEKKVKYNQLLIELYE